MSEKTIKRRNRIKGIRDAQATFQLPQSWKDELVKIATQRSIDEGRNINLTDLLNEILREYLKSRGEVPAVNQ